jgi:threonine/homoserine/homoserine lactone efflux protein
LAVLVVSLIAFVLGFVGSMPLAGPISVMVVSRGVTGYFREALLLALGASLAEGLYAGGAFWGFSALLARYALAIPISHAVTSVVLIAVGIHFLRWKPTEEVEGAVAKRGAGRSAFALGFTASIVNPTLLITWSAVTTAIYSRQIVHMTGLMAIPFGVAAAAGIAAWNVVIVAILKRYRHKFPKRAIQWVIRGMGAVLILIALWSAVDLLRRFTSTAAS